MLTALWLRVMEIWEKLCNGECLMAMYFAMADVCGISLFSVFIMKCLLFTEEVLSQY